MKHFLDWVAKNPGAAAALIGGTFAIVGGFLGIVVWPSLVLAIKSLWDFVKTHFSGKYFENKYLEWVIQEHRYLPILPTTLVPVTEGHHHEMDQLYVSLTVSTNGNRTENTTFTEAVQNHDKLVILGDPGAGKTTMLRFLALTFARARRNKPLGKSSQERKRDFRRIIDARKRTKEFGLKHAPLPIFVYLNRLRDVATWDKGRSLLDALRDEWRSVDSLRDFPPDFFDVKLKAGQCFFLFDAFDELGTQEARDGIARLIGELSNAALPSGNQFVVTSRIVGYQGQLAKYGFRVLTVQNLSWQLIVELVTRWYETLDEPALARQLITTLEANPRIAELALNPMLLSLIALVQYVKRIIPDRRDLLYDECVKILIERRFAPPAVQQMYNNVLPADEAAGLLQKIARNFHREHLREMPRMKLETEILPSILHSIPNSRAANLAPSDLLKNIEERSQLLVERGLSEQGLPLVAFSHLTFQEYLTAADLNNAMATSGQGAVTKHLLSEYEQDPNWWEEVALLYAAQLDQEHREAFFRLLYPLR